MSHHEDADYEIVGESPLHHGTEEPTQSQAAQVVVDLTSDDNAHSMTLGGTLPPLGQQAVVNPPSNERTLALRPRFDDHDDDFPKGIKVKEPVTLPHDLVVSVLRMR